MARPSDGQVVKVFEGTDWMLKDFQGNEAFNNGIVPGHHTIRYEQDGKERTMDGGDGKGSYPLEAMNKLKQQGAKKVQTFGTGELKAAVKTYELYFPKVSILGGEACDSRGSDLFAPCSFCDS